MQRHWNDHALALYWSLATDELAVLPPGEARSRLGVALSRKFFQLEGRFPASPKDRPPVTIHYIAKQLDSDPALVTAYDGQGRTGTRYRHHLRTFLGVRPATVADAQALETWLRQDSVPWDHDPRHLQAAVLGWYRDHPIEPPTDGRIDRVVQAMVHAHEADL